MTDTLELECQTCGALLDDDNRCWHCDYEALQKTSRKQVGDLERKIQQKDQDIKSLQYDLAEAQRENGILKGKIETLESSLVYYKKHVASKFQR